MKYPNFYFERKVWKNRFEFVGGIDEVGRGALAGPVVAGCVVFKRSFRSLDLEIKINDSKKLSSAQRDKANAWIKNNALTWGVGEASAKEIDRLGIVKATNKAMRKAIGKANLRLHSKIQYILIDAFYLPHVPGIRVPRNKIRSRVKIGGVKSNVKKDRMTSLRLSSSQSSKQMAIIKGDSKSFSIACSSIIAKVYRDQLMSKLGRLKKYKKYGWEKNKGYATIEHRFAIRKYGGSNNHRKSFV